MRFDLGFFLREAFKNMLLNPLMSITAVTTTAVCVLILGVGMLVNAHVEGIINRIGQDVTITAFFPEDVSQERADEVYSSVEGYPEVSQVTYVSQEEALERFRSTLSDQPEILEGLPSDVLPASIEIQLADSRSSDAVAEKLQAEGFAEGDLLYNQKTIDNLNQATSYVVWALRGATALFFVASVLLIFNTIRLSIFARRKEIEVMKLVGASDSFVRTPFLFEGLVQGLIGASVAALLVVWVNSVFVAWAQYELPFIPISSNAISTVFLLLVLIAVGVVVGIAGSAFSVRRFLKI
ncbi:MAG: permease-like cell division protein FtsX [Actinomycetota bacterium]|jgi:cell division transport system permease protein|nr:permease-like cell division protein FtsX [Actinomycetota bacterium]